MAHEQQVHQAHETHETHLAHPADEPSASRLAFSATLHCLLGCGTGEVLGMIIGTALHWSNIATIVLAVVLGAVLGFALGIIPLMRANFTFGRAFKQVLIAEGLSIAVMETVDVLVQVNTPGVMDAHLSHPIFWIGMALALVAGFVAAYPVNYVLIKKGVRHQH